MGRVRLRWVTRPTTADFRLVKTLLPSPLKGTVEAEPLSNLPRHLSLCLVSVSACVPEKADVSVE